jgi:phytoene dehydrogenase-like protein
VTSSQRPGVTLSIWSPGQLSHWNPVENLFMVGAATWPGRGVNGGSGYIVAQYLLADMPSRSG